MFCPKCGSELKEGMKFCPDCGSKLKENEKPENKVKNKTENKSKLKKLIWLYHWKDMSTHGKILYAASVFCVGLLLFTATGSLFPDSNTSNQICYMNQSSFILPEECSDFTANNGNIFLNKTNGSAILVLEDFIPEFNEGEIIDSNEIINIDDIAVHKVNYHYNDGARITEYYFNKDSIDYDILTAYGEDDDEIVSSIVKTLKSNNKNENYELYDSYSGSSSSNF